MKVSFNLHLPSINCACVYAGLCYRCGLLCCVSPGPGGQQTGAGHERRDGPQIQGFLWFLEGVFSTCTSISVSSSAHVGMVHLYPHVFPSCVYVLSIHTHMRERDGLAVYKKGPIRFRYQELRNLQAMNTAARSSPAFPSLMYVHVRILCECEKGVSLTVQVPLLFH